MNNCFKDKLEGDVLIVKWREMMGFGPGIARVGWILMMNSYVIIEHVESPVYALLVGLLSMVCEK
jgi:hypothetical protein